MGRKGIPVNLKATSPKGVVIRFKSIPEAAAGLGFSERGVRKAYHARRSRILEYRLEWLKSEEREIANTIKRTKDVLTLKGCIYCGMPLTKEDRISDGFSIFRLNDKGQIIDEHSVKSFYEANKLTGLTYPALINAAEKGNISITRRRDKTKFFIRWGRICDICFEVRRDRRRDGKE